MDEDDDLMAAIRRQAERAHDAKPSLFDVWALARELHALHPHRSESEIAEKIKDVFRSENLQWI